ncbi:MAG: beta-lactamase family protein, partial [Candidatus Eremiobacteraeota bacterium]|nr:beta-lactamase family protein [Candidatus Eremiobacteraeota bacterium]
MYHYLRAAAAICLTAFCFSPALAQSAPAQVVLSQEESAKVDAAAQGALTGLHVPGMAIAIVRDGTVVYRKAFGVTNLATKAAVQAQTQFEIGSITKQFTAAAVLQLVAQGKVKLSDPLSKYVPTYRVGRAVTIQQLLNQVSGIPDYTNVKHFEVIAPKTTPSFERILAMIAGKPLEFAPGTKWKYSNTNYILLGKVIEVASHQPYSTYLFSHVIRPAGMSHTVTMDDEKHLTNFATGYWPKEKGQLSLAPPFGGGWAGSAGFLVSDLDDMVAWDSAFFGGKIVSPADVVLATTPGKLKSGKSTTYGFG